MRNRKVAHIFATERLLNFVRYVSECQLINQEQVGREIYYYFNSKKLKEVDKWLQPFRAMWESGFDQLDTVLKNLKNKRS